MSAATPRYGMVVDLNRCVGCQTCTIACKHANDTPPGVQWRRVLDVEQGRYPDVERLFLVTGCQHCAAPPCVPVCPTGATRQRADGLVTMDYDTCIGCGYCAVACPYQARTIVHEQRWYYGAPTVQEQHSRHPERLGVATKCTFCAERIDAAAARGETPGASPQSAPACAAACIARAIEFGDFNDPLSRVAQLTAHNRSFQMHAELGSDPQIKYLYEVPAATPGRDADAYDLGEERAGDPANPLVGERQRFWDYRAAMNFILGGMSSGLACVAFPAFLAGLLPEAALLRCYAAAGAGIAAGLFFVFLEIGRKRRFLHVLRRPHSSWMSRETYAVALLYPALLADLLWPGAAWHALVFAAAAAFLYSQARIPGAARGIPAWRNPLTPYLLLGGGLLEGGGLLAVALALLDAAPSAIAYAAGCVLVLAVLNALLWQRYLATAARAGIGPRARRELRKLRPALHLLGHLAPPLGLGAALLAGAGSDPGAALAVLGGLAAAAGGVLWKLTFITRACHQQGFALPRLPQRGSGTRAAPPRLQQVC